MQYTNTLLNQLSQLFPASDKQSIHYIADVLLSQSQSQSPLNLNYSNRSSPKTSTFTNNTTNTSMLSAYPTTGLNLSSQQPHYAQAQSQQEIHTTRSFETTPCGMMNFNNNNNNSSNYINNFSAISTSPSMGSMIGEKKDTHDDVEESMFNFGDAFEYNQMSINFTNEDFILEQPEKLLRGSKKINKSKSLTKNSTPCSEKERKQRATSRKGLWKEEEDNLLRDLVETHGPKWAMIGSLIGNKSGKQVRDRYNNISRPDINSAEWTEEEDALFVTLLEKYGHKWCKIAAEMPGRTESQVKNKFYCLKKNKRSRNQRKIALKEAIAVVQQKQTSCQFSESNEDSEESFSKQSIEADFTPAQILTQTSLYSDIDCYFQFTANQNYDNYGENTWQEQNFAL